MVPQPGNSELTRQFLSSVLSQRGPSALPYSEDVKWMIRQHLLALYDVYPSLNIKTSTFTHNDGRSVNLLHADGTVPMLYNGITYNIPVIIWLMESYPHHAPLVMVSPTPDMIIKRPHPFVDPSGVVKIPYLQSWIYPSSNLVELARSLSAHFGRDPPLYSQRRQSPSPTPSSNPYPNPSTSSSINSVNATPGVGPRPAIPPRMTPAVYPPPYSTSGGSIGGRMDDPSEVFRKNAVSKLVDTVHIDIMGLRKIREGEMEGLFNLQGVLRQRAEQLGKGLKEMQDEKEGLEQQLQMVLMNSDVMEAWLRDNEGKLGKLRGNIDVDEVFEPCDVLSQQMLECAVSDLAIEDAIYALDKAAQEGAIPFDQYLRNVRLLSREQFFQRATGSKVRAAQMQAQVASMASRASHYAA
ncbi:unnamed protein product [Coffea canephora]|uniref:UEV domain-containing protein n=1 Tax=Coffea canephora TaxID=49390 RepID=A0A068UAB2_COFCA|nr:unnamed protein product [Coffea canephora]